MATKCAKCKREYTEEVCPYCTMGDVKLSEVLGPDKLHVQTNDTSANNATAFLVDLVSNRKIPITTPRCKVGRDDLNDIVISGDQSISRFHFVITKEDDQYFVQDSKSRHGTFLNGNQITGPVAINDGDVLKVGVSLFWFVIESTSAGSSQEQFAPVDVEAIKQDDLKPSEVEALKNQAKAATSEVDLDAMPALEQAMKAAAKQPDANDTATRLPPAGVEPPQKADKDEGESTQITASMLLQALEQEAMKEGEEQQSSAPTDSKEKTEKPEREGEAEKSEEESKQEKEEQEPPKDKDEEEKLKKSSQDEDAESASTSARAKDKSETEESEPSSSRESASTEDKEKSSKAGDDGESVKSKEGDKEGEKESLPPKGDRGKDKESESTAKEPISESEEREMTKSLLDELLPEEEEEKHRAGKQSSAEDKISGRDKEGSEPAGDEGDSKRRAEPAGDGTSQSTLDKLAGVMGEAAKTEGKNDSSPEKDKDLSEVISGEFEPPKERGAGESKVDQERLDAAREATDSDTEDITSNGATSGMSITQESTSTKVPDWCAKYFASELNTLNKELDNLNEQVRAAQQKIKEVENRIAATRSLRNTLLTATGEDLVEACGKVLARLGWRVKIVSDDKQELRLESDDKVSICRIIWTNGMPERSHLGQLSVAQTRYWIEQAAEPKGILIVAQTGEKPPLKITKSELDGELSEYAAKKGFCLMTTLQLLAMYKEIALNEASPETLRGAITSTDGWLSGYSLEPSEEDEKEPNKLSTLLS
ncbi:MAG TPA: FHA domain-containing protein [Candidatus Obscuribacterales bacterium]